MKTIMLKDGNNNAEEIIELLKYFYNKHGEDCKIIIRGTDMVPKEGGTIINMSVSEDERIVYEFQKKIESDHEIETDYFYLIQMLSSVRTVYFGEIEIVNESGIVLKMSIIDGDIIELQV